MVRFGSSGGAQRQSWLVFAWRVLAALLLAPSLYLLTSTGAMKLDDQLTYTSRTKLGDRSLVALEQVSAINQGHYLVDRQGQSVTALAREDIGNLLLLADLALLRNGLGLGPLDEAAALNSRAIMAVFILSAMILVGVRWHIVALACLVVVLFAPLHANLESERTWPQVAAVAIFFSLLDLTMRGVEERPRSSLLLARLYAMGLLAGCLGFFRSEARYINLLPFVVFFSANAFALLGQLAAESFRAAAGGSSAWWARIRSAGAAGVGYARALPGRFLERDQGVRSLVVAGIVLAGILSAGPASRLNIALFEVIEDAHHQPEVGKHLFWHPMFVGLGRRWHSPENVAWVDDLGVIEALRTNGYFEYFGLDSERAARSRFLDIMLSNTGFFVDSYLDKVRGLFGKRGDHQFMLAAAVAILSILFYVSSRSGSRLSGISYALCVGAAIMAAAAPAVVAGAAYSAAFKPMLTATMLFGGAAIGERITRAPAQLPGAEAHGRRLVCVIATAFVMAGVALAFVIARIGAIEEHRSQLTQQLARGELSFDALLGEYHADAVSAFNRLPSASRRELAAKITAQAPAGFVSGVRGARSRASYDLLDARRTDETLFLLIRLKRKTQGDHVIPVRLDLLRKQEWDDRGRGSSTLFFSANTKNDLVFLPRSTKRGVWLLSLRAPTSTVETCVVGESMPFSREAYSVAVRVDSP